jgi:hypothetical protein
MKKPLWSTSTPTRTISIALASVFASVLALGLFTVAAHAAKPEDVFKGKVIITKDRLPTRFTSANAFIAQIQRARTDKIWPKEEKGDDHAVWSLEYIAFFAQPLNDNEVNVKFFEITGGQHRFVAGDEQYTRERGSRIFASNIQLARPEFEVNKRYLMTVESGRRTLAMTTFWLRGKGPNYSGKVEFSDDDAKGK